MNVTGQNIEKLVYDLKSDLKIENFTPESELLDELLRLGLLGLDVGDEVKLKDQVDDMKEALYRIISIAEDF